jgi:predicted kinase
MKNLFITIGIPGCGKTTWVKNKIKEIGGVHISRDEIRFSLLNENDNYFDKEIEVFEKFISTIQESIDNEIDNNIFIDATHLSESSRNKLLSRINTRGNNITFVNFEVPLEIALKRNEKRTGRAFVPRGQIRRMFFQKDLNGLTNKTIITINERGEHM